MFTNIIHNHINHNWLSERAILAGKDDLVIQNEIAGTLHSFQSIDGVTKEYEVTNYPSEFLNFFDVG